MTESVLTLRRAVEESIKPLPLKTDEIKNRRPLVFYLISRPYIVVFSEVSSNLEADYDHAMMQLKELYIEHSNEWRNMDLCLVLCLEGPETANPEVCNRIELDPYFCRKFILDLSSEYRRSLQRLPFIPLSNIGVRATDGYERPISCQTMLKQQGVPADLARSLATPSKMSEQTIVDKCLSRQFRMPQLGRPSQEVFEEIQSSRGDKIRVKNLEIQGFRAYERKVKFDLDADIVVLFGPNGLGKTSFFDALDYCCTGGVGRFDERYSRSPDRIARVLRNLDAQGSFLRLEVARNGTQSVIERSVGEKGAMVDGKPTERTDVLLALTGYQREENDLRLSNLVNLFRASHLFGQDFRTLTEGLETESSLPENIVSRMLAFQDYVEAISKSQKVLDELNKIAREKQNGIDTLGESTNSAEQEIQRLTVSAKQASDPKVLTRLRTKILKALQASLDIDWPNDRELDFDALHAWRTRLAVEKNSLAEQVNVIKDIEAIEQPAGTANRSIDKVTTLVNLKRDALQAAEKASRKKGSEVATLTQKANGIIFELGQVRTQTDNQTWLVRHQPELVRLRGLVEARSKELEKETDSLATTNKTASDLGELVRTAQHRLDKLEGDVQKHEATIVEINSFLDSLPQWGLEEEAIGRLENDLARYQADVAKLQKQSSDVSAQLMSETVELEKNKKLVSLLQQSQEDLHNLLDNIKRHIVNEVCPVCGTVHSSSKNLLARLAERRGVQPDELRIALMQLEQSQTRVASLTKRSAEIQGELGKRESLIFSVQGPLDEALKRRQQFEENARRLDLTPKPAEAIAQSGQHRDIVTKQLNDIRGAEEGTRKGIQELKARQVDLLDTRENVENRIYSLRDQLEKTQSALRVIELEAAMRGVSLDSDPEALRGEIDLLNKKSGELTKSNEEGQKILRDAQRDKNELDSEVQRQRSELSQSESQLNQLTNLITRYNRLAEAAGLPPEPTQPDISVKKTQLERSLSEIVALESQAVSFEIALDATQKSAAIAKLQQDIERNRLQSKELSDALAQVWEWTSVFEGIHKELERVQKKALTGYTRFFGPLASTIQKRLRSFYGFGDIILTPSKGRIDVRVERGDSDNISPSDYMSQSQIQIVMLSLFLSATITQNWSSFCPILLDDPFTHFDDFNAYSFVDFLRAIVNDPSNEHQVILSTCEERLFQLIQQKFKGSGARVGYHVFESIGERGPMVNTMFN